MDSTSLYSLELSVLEGTGGKALATDHRARWSCWWTEQPEMFSLNLYENEMRFQREKVLSLFLALEWLPRMCIWIRKESWFSELILTYRHKQLVSKGSPHVSFELEHNNLTWHTLWTSLLCCMLCHNHQVHNEFWISDLYLNVPNCNVFVKMQAKMLQTLHTRDISMPCFRPHPFDNGGLDPSKL